MSKKALVVGASGLVGSHLVKQLSESEAYSKIIVLSRRTLPETDSKTEVRLIDFDEVDQLKIDEKIDACFCALGTTTGKSGKEGLVKVDYTYVVKLGLMCKANAIPKFLIVSSQGANAESSFHYMRTKGQMELAVKKQALKSTYMMRPSLILGDRNEFRLGEKVGEFLYKVAGPFMSGKLKKYRAVEAKKIAACMIAKAQDSAEGFFIIDSDEIQAY